MLDIASINIAARVALLTDGTLAPITNLFDVAGDETQDAGEAVSFVCGYGGCWLSDMIDRYEKATVQ